MKTLNVSQNYIATMHVSGVILMLLCIFILQLYKLMQNVSGACPFKTHCHSVTVFLMVARGQSLTHKLMGLFIYQKSNYAHTGNKYKFYVSIRWP